MFGTDTTRIADMLDLFTASYAASYVEVRPWCEKKIVNGEVAFCSFVVYPESPNAQKYDFKVCKRYSEEEEKLACAHNKCLKQEETWWIKLDLGIRDLAIAQRWRWRDKK